ncbi:hypothetical protein AKJ16_DCAP27361, partial [Drosera capensis]
RSISFLLRCRLRRDDPVAAHHRAADIAARSPAIINRNLPFPISSVQQRDFSVNLALWCSIFATVVCTLKGDFSVNLALWCSIFATVVCTVVLGFRRL